MINLATATDQLTATIPQPHADVTRVLAVARFFRIRRNDDGSETHFWELTKPLDVYPAGTVLPLAKLHELVFGP